MNKVEDNSKISININLNMEKKPRQEIKYIWLNRLAIIKLLVGNWIIIR